MKKAKLFLVLIMVLVLSIPLLAFTTNNEVKTAYAEEVESAPAFEIRFERSDGAERFDFFYNLVLENMESSEPHLFLLLNIQLHRVGRWFHVFELSSPFYMHIIDGEEIISEEYIIFKSYKISEDFKTLLDSDDEWQTFENIETYVDIMWFALLNWWEDDWENWDSDDFRIEENYFHTSLPTKMHIRQEQEKKPEIVITSYSSPTAVCPFHPFIRQGEHRYFVVTLPEGIDEEVVIAVTSEGGVGGTMLVQTYSRADSTHRILGLFPGPVTLTFFVPGTNLIKSIDYIIYHINAPLDIEIEVGETLQLSVEIWLDIFSPASLDALPELYFDTWGWLSPLRIELSPSGLITGKEAGIVTILVGTVPLGSEIKNVDWRDHWFAFTVEVVEAECPYGNTNSDNDCEDCDESDCVGEEEYCDECEGENECECEDEGEDEDEKSIIGGIINHDIWDNMTFRIVMPIVGVVAGLIIVGLILSKVLKFFKRTGRRRYV